MRIAIIHQRMDVKGGAENVNIWLADGLRRRGHRVTLFAERFAPELWPAAMTEGLDMRPVGPAVARLVNSRGWRSFFYTRSLARSLADYDVVLAQHFPTYVWATAARERAGGAWRVVWLCQEPFRMMYPTVTDRHLLEWREHTPAGVANDHLAATADALRSRLERRRCKLARDRRWDLEGARRCDHILCNSDFTAANVREVFGLRANVCRPGAPMPSEQDHCPGDYVAVLTSLSPKKNVQNVLRAVRELANQGASDIRLKVAGGGKGRPLLGALAADLGLGAQVEFLGPLSDEELPEYYRRARVVVYCPIDEPFGLVPVEALAMKTPVVVSDHGGPAEVVEDGRTGLHANPFDPADIARAIQALWRDPAAARAMGEEGCRRVRREYSLDAFLDRFEALVIGH